MSSVVDVLALVLVFALPKAGLLVGGVPVTFASMVMAGHGAWRWVMPGAQGAPVHLARSFVQRHLVFAWAVTVVLLVQLTDSGVEDLVTWALLIGSPIAFHAGLHVRRTGAVMAAILVAAVLVGGYAVVQNVVGVEEASVEGITFVAGTDLVEDNPIRTPSGTLKSPSTFHNGNLAASFLLLAIGVAAVASVVERRLRGLALLAVAVSVAGIAVSLSRSAVLALVLALFIALAPRHRPEWLGRRAASLVAVALLFAGSLVAGYVLFGAENFLVDRFVGDSVEDPTAAGRTDGAGQWWDDLRIEDSGGLLEALLVGNTEVSLDDQVEGIVFIVGRYGLLVAAAFVIMAVGPMREWRRRLGRTSTVAWLGPAALSIMWLVDSTFLFPPTLLNWAFVCGLITRLVNQPSLWGVVRVVEPPSVVIDRHSASDRDKGGVVDDASTVPGLDAGSSRTEVLT